MEAATFIPNAKPQIVEDAIQRETWRPVGHFLNPFDPSGRTALCGAKILGVPVGNQPYELCAACEREAAARSRPLP